MHLDGWKEWLFQKYLHWKGRPWRIKKFVFSSGSRKGFSAGKREFPKPGHSFKVAAVQLEARLFSEPLEYVREMQDKVEVACREGASLAVFPEYNNLQLLGMLPGVEEVSGEGVPGLNSGGVTNEAGSENNPVGTARNIAVPAGITVSDIVQFAGPVTRKIVETTFSALAARYGIYIMSGSFLLPGEGGMVNRAYLYNPEGKLVGTQDKVHLTPMEEGWGGMVRGNDFKVFPTSLGNMALPVCMDATYFETFRILELKGARLVALPIANPEPYHFWLAMRGIWPRVQESLVYGVKGALVGSLPGITFTGKAGVFAPLELTPGADGVLDEVEHPDREGMALATLDMQALEELRREHPRRDFNLPLYERYFPGVYRENKQDKSSR